MQTKTEKKTTKFAWHVKSSISHSLIVWKCLVGYYVEIELFLLTI